MVIEKQNQLKGHLSALLSTIIAGSAYIFTKILLQKIGPEELMFLRFILAYISLWIMSPKKLTLNKKEERLCALIGFVGLTLYYFIQNIALMLTSASNVSVIYSTSPIIAAFISYLIYRKDKISKNFIIGFLISFSGVVLVISNGKLDFSGSMLGNILALMTAFLWACYSLLVENLKKYSMILVTRRIFFYGIITSLPIMIASDVNIQWKEICSLNMIISLLYIGCIASAVSFVVWNISVQILGTIKTNIYMYLMPVVTIVFSALFLNERITIVGIIGVILTLTGVFFSQKVKR